MIVECPGCHTRYDVSGRRIGSRAKCRCGTSFAVPRPIISTYTLQCAACGAPCAPDDSSCSYCRAVLAVVACPVCFGRVFAGSDHCVHCGAAIVVGAKGDPDLLPMRACPRCPAPAELIPRLIAETLLDECHRCGGVWVESAVFEALVKDRDQQGRLEAVVVPELIIEAGAPTSTNVAPSAPRREYIPCPDCRQLMNRKNFAGVSGVLVDVCKPHGMWFDKGELGRIVKFVMNGGLLAARRREIEELAREVRQKRTEATQVHVLSEPVSSESRPGWIGELVDAFFQLLRP